MPLATYSHDSRGGYSGATTGPTTASYTFDPAGRRLSRTQAGTATTYLYAGGGETLTFETVAGQITASATDSPFGDLARFAGAPVTSSVVTYLYLDAHGTALAKADAGSSTSRSDASSAATVTVQRATEGAFARSITCRRRRRSVRG